MFTNVEFCNSNRYKQQRSPQKINLSKEPKRVWNFSMKRDLEKRNKVVPPNSKGLLSKVFLKGAICSALISPSIIP